MKTKLIAISALYALATGKRGGTKSHEKFMRDYAVKATSVGTKSRKHFRVDPEEVDRVLADVARVRGQQMPLPLPVAQPAGSRAPRSVRVVVDKAGNATFDVPVDLLGDVIAQIAGWRSTSGCSSMPV